MQRLITRGTYDHVGMVLRNRRGQIYVLECMGDTVGLSKLAVSFEGKLSRRLCSAAFRISIFNSDNFGWCPGSNSDAMEGVC